MEQNKQIKDKEGRKVQKKKTWHIKRKEGSLKGGS